MKGKELVKLVDGVPLISTLDMYVPLGVQHTAIVKLIQKHEDRFQRIRKFEFAVMKSTGGRPAVYCQLDEVQATFLITLMRNSDVVVSFKAKLVDEFYRLKELLSDLSAQQKNQEWIEKRSLSKQGRIQETDVIKRFVEYAMAQGSENAERYYANISKMENKSLFMVEQEFPNLRQVLNLTQLSTIVNADMIVSKAIEDGMNMKLNYKEIYKLAKERIEKFSEILGKSVVPSADKFLPRNTEKTIGGKQC